MYYQNWHLLNSITNIKGNVPRKVRRFYGEFKEDRDKELLADS